MMINLSNVLNLTVKQDYGVKKQKENNNLADCSKNNTNAKLASPSLAHLKANYLTFSGNEKSAKETQVELPSFLENMLSGESLLNNLKFKPYERTADLVAQNCFKGDNTILAYEEGAMQNSVANNFAGMLAQGKFKNLGMTKENTEVYFVDTNAALENINVNLNDRINDRIEKEGEKANTETIIAEEKQKPDPDIQKMQMLWHEKAEKENKNVVIFVSDPTIMAFKPSSSGIRTVSFAPLQPEIPGTAKQSSPFSPQVQNLLRMDPSINVISLPFPGAPETKSFLKEHKDKLIMPGLPPGIRMSDKTIDKAVDMTKEKAGVYPDKAINFLLDAAPAVLMKKHLNPNSKSTVITPNNLEKGVSAYHELFEEPKESKPYSLTLDTKIKLKDVGGIDQIEDFVRESIINKINPTKGKKSQIAPPSSVLISGEDGSGKKFLAKAIAGEANAPLVTLPTLRLLDTLGAKKMTGSTDISDIKEVFDYAKSVAKDSDNKTAFLYIDDFDILAPAPHAKSDLDVYRTEIFNEIKKIDNKNSDINIIVLAASEDAKIHQDEFSKKGVFDNKIQTPDTINSKNARISAIRLFTKDLTFESEKNKEKIIQETAKVTEGANGAELKTIIHKAGAIADRRKEDKNLTINDIYESLLELEAGPIIKAENADWDKEGTIKHETGHALVAQTLLNMSKEEWQRPNEIEFITFDPRGHFAGMVCFNKGENGMHTFDSLIAELAVGYGGYYAEKMIFNGRNTHGPVSDLEQSTKLAEAGVKHFGLGYHTGLISDERLMPAENKKDVSLMINVGSKISEMVIDFHKDFINEYGDKCFDNLGKGGNTMSGESFKKDLDSWLDKDNRREKLKLLEAKIEVLRDEARLKGKFIEKDNQLNLMAIAKLQRTKA